MTMVLVITLLAATSQAFAGEWQVLFDGTNLDGWKPSSDNKQFELVDGVILGSSSGQTRFLHTEQEYGDFELEFEVKLHDLDLNSGVQIRTSLIRVNERGDERPSVHGPQVDLGKSPGRSGYIYNLLPKNPVGFPSRCRLFDHVDELFREVGHGDERFEFRGDLLGNILSFSEGFAEGIDIDFSEDFFEGCLSIKQDPRVGGILQVSDQRGFGEYRAKHAA
jgi:hypothetical protein